ncbi:MAG: cyclic nucleotide-binding domain-containing protein, partial [Fimbriimonas ginsengisoli]|nr:cyclic nucleotide-binding domain-containing protein [Fimbriimonas ginsengisoli]
EAVKRIADLSRLETYLAGESLIQVGEKSGDLYVILEGQVSIVTEAGDRLAEAGPGSVLGEVALIDDQPRSAAAVATGLTRAARLPAGELRAFMKQNRDIGFTVLANLAAVLCHRLRNADRKIDALNCQDPWRGSL